MSLDSRHIFHVVVRIDHLILQCTLKLRVQRFQNQRNRLVSHAWVFQIQIQCIFCSPQRSSIFHHLRLPNALIRHPKIVSLHRVPELDEHVLESVMPFAFSDPCIHASMPNNAESIKRFVAAISPPRLETSFLLVVSTLSKNASTCDLDIYTTYKQHIIFH